MATYETKGRLTYKDENSDNHIIYPVTRMDCIEDMPDIEKEVAESVAAYLEENPVETPDITAQVERAEAAATTAEAAKESVNTSVNLAGGYASSASSYAVRAENAATRAEEAAASIPESGGGTVKTVNGVEPDENGNVEITIPGSGGEDIESIDVPGDGTVEIHRADGNVDCYPFTSAYNVKTVNGTAPDENGNVEITIPDSGGNVDLTGYATEQFVRDGYQPKGNYLTEVPEGYAKTTDIPTKPEDIGALPNTYTPPNQTAEQVGADPTGTAENKVSEHNTDTASHNDLRLELKALSDRLTAFFDSDDATLDELSEIVAYITNNKTLIESITISKVSVSDIIDNLVTNVANKPLSAAQGVVLKGLIDTLSNRLSNYQPKGDYALRAELPTVPTKVSAFSNDAGYLTKHQDISGKADKTGLTLGIHTDGLVYLFVDGAPVGSGIELSSGGVSGYVDENNNIILNNLPDGTYTVKYEMEDGSTIEIGDLVLDTNVYYTVTNTLTNCTNSNSATEVIGGEPYSATITADSGYELSSVVVTMGGTDISASAVSGGNISIAEVTGNIVITAVAEEATVAINNLAEPTDAAGQTAWESGGWCNDSYMAGSSYAYRGATDGRITTNTFAVEHGDIIYVKGIKYSEGSDCQLAGFDSSGAYIKHASVYNMGTSQGFVKDLTGTVGEDYWYFTNVLKSGGGDNSIRFIRLAGKPSGSISDIIITRNQPIV